MNSFEDESTRSDRNLTLRTCVAAILVALGAAGCSVDAETKSPPPTEEVASAADAVVGADGAVTVAAANTVLNTYAVLSADVAAGAQSLTVADVATLTSPLFGPLAAGDQILVIQMQGATIDTTDSAAYGTVSSLGSAGRYEFIGVTGVTGNTIQLENDCGGLSNAYSAAGHTQIVRVPQMTNLTISAGASVTAPAWNGATGGIVAVHATGTITLNGGVSASGLGFRGGSVDNSSANAGSNVNIFRANDPAQGAEKGESIAGFTAEYDALSGRFGRGAPANGGGGGNSHNAGGGGGANGRNGSAYTGQGVMAPASNAWPLDPAFTANGNALTTSEGGGRGGYTYSANNGNALTQGPGDAAWGGDNRRQAGGFGGRPLDNATNARLFFGGGGGAGDGNNGGAGGGGRGGGMVFLLGATITGTAAVTANGQNGTATSANGNDAPGGGGGGGTIVLRATATLNGITASANGGTGGTQSIATTEAEGPGGGGSGGFIALAGGNITATANGANGGTSNSSSVNEFTTNGATAGNAGQANASSGTIRACIDVTTPDTTITSQPSNPTNQTNASFNYTANDAGSTFECKLDAGPFTTCAAAGQNYMGLAQGSHTFQVRATDSYGNVDPTPATYTWSIDTVPPDTQIVTNPPNPSNSSTGSFTYTSTEGSSTFTCTLDGVGVACGVSYTTPALPNGNHTFTVAAVDPAGNVDPTPATYTWTIVGDTDGDGLPDSEEISIGTNPNDADSDDDGILDGAEPQHAVDSDGDGLINALDPDSDNDGLFDGTEVGITAPSPATSVAAGHFKADADPSTTTNPLVADTDGGSVKDGAEDANLDGKLDAGETDPTLGHGADDVMVIDTDGDGLSDKTEITIGTNPNDADTDDDGVVDGAEPNPAIDFDGDGLIDALDPDSDNDGLFDGTEMGLGCGNPATNAAAGVCIADADMGATKTSPLDSDTDDGSVSDGSEDGNHNGKLDAGETDPTAGHGADDVGVIDTDGDGLSDLFEDSIGSDKNDADTDDDGLIDGLEPNPTVDSDGDGLIGVLDPDADNDALPDGLEAGVTTPNADTDTTKGFFIADTDASTKTSSLKKDTDNGGVSDGSEDANRNGKVDAGEINPNIGADDATSIDTDGDGLSDKLENALGSNPNDADTDDDGVKDGAEPNPAIDADGDGLIDVLDPDSDDDALFDGTELGLGCNDPATAAGGPCIADADAGATKTSPLDPDTDHGGATDGSEDANRNGKLDAGEKDPTKGHGSDDAAVVDTDGDGLGDLLEGNLGSNPNDTDTDDDGVPDGAEPNPSADGDHDFLIDVLDVDSDNDGLYDGTELGLDCGNAGTDTSKNHCTADADGGSTVTSPLNPDTDGGGVIDGSEDANLDGKLDAGEADPTKGHGSDDAAVVDTDGDGLSDGLETTLGSGVDDADSDDDGLLDGDEPNPSDDFDGDGKDDILDPDSDADGLFDGTEFGNDCGNAATDKSKNQCTADGDAGATTTHVLDADTDNGSVPDGTEDADHDGVVDTGEKDPNDPADDTTMTGCTTDADCGNALSGKVCDDTTKTCENGCRGMGGNGCPDGEHCTSTTNAIGECVMDGTGGAGGGTTSSSTSGAGGGEPGAYAEGNGIFCATSTTETPATGWLIAFGAIASLALARRSRARKG